MVTVGPVTEHEMKSTTRKKAAPLLGAALLVDIDAVRIIVDRFDHGPELCENGSGPGAGGPVGAIEHEFQAR